LGRRLEWGGRVCCHGCGNAALCQLSAHQASSARPERLPLLHPVRRKRLVVDDVVTAQLQDVFDH
jgi:hypothetical protein